MCDVGAWITDSNALFIYFARKKVLLLVCCDCDHEFTENGTIYLCCIQTMFNLHSCFRRISSSSLSC